VDGGRLVSIDDLWQRICANPLLTGITLSGGEPFEQPKPLLTLAGLARAHALTVWAYSGYRYEELLAGQPSAAARTLLLACDVLVDGPFVAALASFDLKWRGSSNQRIIDVAASQAHDTVILLNI
jgi:anaerobic ribonucleoside-triphosphate reductase activating protein